jgi:hypothetical protein
MAGPEVESGPAKPSREKTMTLQDHLREKGLGIFAAATLCAFSVAAAVWPSPGKRYRTFAS